MLFFKSHTGGLTAIWNGLLLIGLSINVEAQISPGELSGAHAHLEGMLSCTKCHVLGDKVSNEKCLECHTEIKSRVDQQKGYHTSSEVAGTDCVKCHSDHHGRGFEIIRFDKDKFDHQKTGYKLDGAHAELDCKACHKSEWISRVELKKKKSTYLGLPTDCKACHKDVHRNTLSTTDCSSCHNTEAFAPAVLFDHDETKFPLKGKHKDADCKRCHELTFSNSALFQRFAGIPFSSCTACHEDVHGGKFGSDCKKCHTEDSFLELRGDRSFDHSQTDFPLVGKHQNIDCTKCHKMGENAQAESVFQDYKGKDFNQCITCHKDAHEMRFGIDCRKCHSEESFQKIRNRDELDHALTGYPLEGKHATVDCRKCHETPRMTDPVIHNRCADCHDDFHKGQFLKTNYTPDCKECHSVEGFQGSLYTLEQHNEGVFPLAGAHLATPCLECHKKNEEWSFRNIGQNCIDCHSDVHEGFLNEKYYPQKACNQCHTADDWAIVSFDHLLTGFELKGKHDQTRCAACHKPESSGVTTAEVPFSGLKQNCFTCHDNIHDRQFEAEGVTDCRKCHGSEQWKPSNFDHNTARFVLDGKHKNVACKECHKEEIINEKKVIRYKLENFECATCHGGN